MHKRYLLKFTKEKGKENKSRERRKMKSVNDNSNGSSSNNNNNWLGFSLSPQMKSDASSDPLNHHFNHQLTQQASPVPTSYFLSPPPQLNTSPICYEVGQNGNFHSSLSVMPLKSDGSLCIMEALNRSHSQGQFFLPFLLFLDFPFMILGFLSFILGAFNRKVTK